MIEDVICYVRKKLLETRDFLIASYCKRYILKDSFGEWGETRTRQNTLVKVWMNPRDEIRNTDKW